MAKYLTMEPCFIQGKYIANFARPDDPATIEVPDDHEPSRKWIPLDEAGQKALAALGKKKSVILAAPHTGDKITYDQVVAKTLKEYNKPIPKEVERKVVVREVDTNSEIAEKTARVVGRNADKSPV